jgi:hypothetical protein
MGYDVSHAHHVLDVLSEGELGRTCGPYVPLRCFTTPQPPSFTFPLAHIKIASVVTLP